MDPNDPATVYVGSFGGLAKTVDAGNTWTLPSNYFSTSLPYSIAVDPANTQVVYAATGTTGIAQSVNGGGSWVARNNGLPTVGADVPIQYVTIDPADSQRLYAIALNAGALYRTTDAGLNWSRVGGGLPTSESVRTVAFDPFDPNRVYLGADSGLYRSIDGGSTWSVVPTPVNTRFVSSISMDPVVPGVFVLVAGGSLVPALRTVDHGATWESLSWETAPEEFVSPRSGVLDPSSPGNLILGAVNSSVREFQIAPDLSVSLSGLASPLRAGVPATLRMTVQNKATSLFAASDATATLTLSAQLAPGTVTASRGSCTRAGQTVTCRMGVMRVGDAAQVDVTFTPSAGTGAVSAAVSPREPDASSADNSTAQPVTALPFAGLAAAITAPASVDHNTTTTVQGRMTNAGPDTAVNASLVFALPTGLTVLPGGIGAPCTAGTGVVTCLIGTLPSGGQATVDLQLRAATPGGQDVTVTVTSNSYDTDASNNSASASIAVKPVADLGIALSAPPAALQAGQAASATATVTNAGPDAVTIAVANFSAANLTVTAATPNGGSCSVTNGAASCSLGTIAAGTSKTIEVTYTAGSAGAAQLNGTTSSEASDGSSTNNSAATALTVSAPPSNGGGGGGSSGGGGGALGLWGALGLLVWTVRRGSWIRASPPTPAPPSRPRTAMAAPRDSRRPIPSH